MTFRNAVEFACSYVAMHLKHRLITRGDDQPYLLRHYLRRHSEHFKKLPGLYLHCFLASDDEDELHNHPFQWSLSLILSGGYFEDRVVWWNRSWKPGDPGEPMEIQRKEIKPFRLNFIRANDYHRVDLRDGRAWTLFLAGPRTQDWGFLDPETGEFLQWEAHIRRRGEKTQSDRFRAVG